MLSRRLSHTRFLRTGTKWRSHSTQPITTYSLKLASQTKEVFTRDFPLGLECLISAQFKVQISRWSNMKNTTRAGSDPKTFLCCNFKVRATTNSLKHSWFSSYHVISNLKELHVPSMTRCKNISPNTSSLLKLRRTSLICKKWCHWTKHCRRFQTVKN